LNATGSKPRVIVIRVHIVDNVGTVHARDLPGVFVAMFASCYLAALVFLGYGIIGQASWSLLTAGGFGFVGGFIEAASWRAVASVAILTTLARGTPPSREWRVKDLRVDLDRDREDPS
jgi:hypothetical protein